jgi:hypothetical protein
MAKRLAGANSLYAHRVVEKLALLELHISGIIHHFRLILTTLFTDGWAYLAFKSRSAYRPFFHAVSFKIARRMHVFAYWKGMLFSPLALDGVGEVDGHEKGSF